MPDNDEENAENVGNEPVAENVGNEPAADKAPADQTPKDGAKASIDAFAARVGQVNSEKLSEADYGDVKTAVEGLTVMLTDAKYNKTAPLSTTQRLRNAASAVTGFGKKGGSRAPTRRRRNRRAGKSRRRRR